MQHAQRHYSLDEYFAIEEMSEIRHEYFDGEILAMSGGTPSHNQIAINLRNALHAALRPRGCRGYVSDLRLNTPSGLYTYPDVMIVCGHPLLTSDPGVTVTNPIIVGEILSKATSDYDRGEKFDLCRTVTTLEHYLLADQYSIDVEHRRRDGNRWSSARYTSLDSVIEISGGRVTLAAIYDDIQFT